MAESNLHKLSKRGQSVWIDSLSRTMLDTGEARAADEGGRRRRRDDEPDDLPEGDLRGRRVRRAAARSCSRTETDPKEIFLQLSARDVEAALDLLAHGARGERAGRLRLVGGRPDARVRPRGDVRRGDAPARVARQAEPLREDPGDEARPRRDRGLHRAREEHQRDADLLAPALHARSSRRTCAGSSGSSRPAATRRRCTRSRASSSRVSTPRPTSGSRRSARKEALALRGKLAIANAKLAYEHYQERVLPASAGSSSRARAQRRSAASGRRPRRRTRSTAT